MNLKLLPILALLLFAAAPVVIGSAEQAKKEDSIKTIAEGKAKEGKTEDTAATEKPARKFSSECLASEEVIADLEAREEKLKQREEKLKEHEQEVAAQETSVKEEMSKLEAKRADLQATHEKEMASREEQVNKLIETFEGMSPKAAAQVIGGVDDELAVIALGKLTSVKAGKILANLKADKSAHLSELMAYGKKGKESARVESNNRVPAEASKR